MAKSSQVRSRPVERPKQKTEAPKTSSRSADGGSKAKSAQDASKGKPANDAAASEVSRPKPTTKELGDRIRDRQARERANTDVQQLRNRLEGGTATSLMTERLGDGQANCLEHAATHAQPGRDEVVFLDDNRPGAEGDAGHALIRDRASGRVWDPSRGAPPTNPQAWPHRNVDSWVAENGGAPGGTPAYQEAAAVPAEHVQDVLSLPPEQRVARVAELDNPGLTQVANRLYADGDPAQGGDISRARRRDLDAYVNRHADSGFPGRAAVEALRGETNLGRLNEAEQRYLIENSVAGWRQQPSIYLSQGTAQLAREAAENPALRGVVSDTFARSAIDAQRQSGDDMGARVDGVLFAERAVWAAGTPQARRQLLDSLGPEDAGRFAAALRPNDERILPISAPGMERRSEAAGLMLEAASRGTPNAATRAFSEQAFFDLPPEAYEGRRNAGTRHHMANALAAHWHEDDPAARSREAARFEGILGTCQGRDLLAQTDAPPQARANAINLIRNHPEWNADTFRQHDGNGWTHPTIMREMARPRANDFLELRGDAPQTLSGTRLENTIGFAMGFPPPVPENETEAQRDAREAAVARGEHNYYANGPMAESVRPVADAIRAVGGDDPQVTVLPVQYSSPETGPVELPLFRVQDAQTGQDRFVDNTGRRYNSFDDWRENNQLPPGNMTFPPGGHLRQTQGGGAALQSENTPKTVDTWGERITGALDTAALVGGVVAGGFIIAGSGGTAAPFVLGGASAWGAFRSAGRLEDRYSHGQSINPFNDAGARSAWLDFGANTLGVFGLGATGVASRLASRGSALTPLAATAAGALNVGAAGADVLAVGDAGYTLVSRWNELSGAERAQLGLSMAFWGVSAAARPSAAGARPVDTFDANAMRRALLQQETAFQTGRAQTYGQQVLPPAARPDADGLINQVAGNDRIQGFRDWVQFSTNQGRGVDPGQQARNYLDDLGELQVAQAMTPGLRPGETIHVGGDARARTRPGTTETLPSFDLVVQGPNGPRNIEVYSPHGRADVSDFGRAINHARDKIIRDPTLPGAYQTRGPVEAAIRIDWPPAGRNVGPGRLETAPNGDITLTTGNGRTIDRGNFFRDYVDTLNGGRRAPDGARDVNALTVYDQNGAPLFRYTRDPATGTWSGAPL